ncbi:MAG: hypothetical protein ACKPGT_29915, partial [Microcystis sp.]
MRQKACWWGVGFGRELSRTGVGFYSPRSLQWLALSGNLILIFAVFEPSKINYARGLINTLIKHEG